MKLGTGLGKLDLGHIDLGEAKRLARRAAELIEAGVVGYTLIAATKGEERSANQAQCQMEPAGHAPCGCCDISSAT